MACEDEIYEKLIALVCVDQIVVITKYRKNFKNSVQSLEKEVANRELMMTQNKHLSR